jgi:hypothetical protein
MSLCSAGEASGPATVSIISRYAFAQASSNQSNAVLALALAFQRFEPVGAALFAGSADCDPASAYIRHLVICATASSHSAGPLKPLFNWRVS